ncbi:hypothetical protein PSPO01_01008 [Paraphaeosphaeria sporulosa]
MYLALGRNPLCITTKKLTERSGMSMHTTIQSCGESSVITYTRSTSFTALILCCSRSLRAPHHGPRQSQWYRCRPIRVDVFELPKNLGRNTCRNTTSSGYRTVG